MEYIGFDINCDLTALDILVAELSEAGFDSFLENEVGMEAYCPKDLYVKDHVDEIFKKYSMIFEIQVFEKIIEKKNWNEEWEKNYDPIYIDSDIQVRATFHKSLPGFKHEIVIDPKMSFGTGHHSTTSMMLCNQMEIDHKSKNVLDAGSGTGILAIMAKKLGANMVKANDIDDWCIDNAKENIALNGFPDIDVHLGPVSQLQFNNHEFDIILANINKNVLIMEIPEYSRIIKSDGILILSGFYEHDLVDIQQKAYEFGFELLTHKVKKDWCSPIFKRV
jgi:ribosomal protein L11 methyltransferase